MSNPVTNFVNQGIALAEKAVEADKNKDYEKACNHYQQCLEYFQHAIVYEKNDVAKKKLQEYFKQYLERLEYLRDMLDKKAAAEEDNMNNNGNSEGGLATGSQNDKEDSVDKETAKLRGALSDKILTSKPNVKWSDVAGLEAAKEALKEAVILPVKFPQLFTGKRRPWKGILLYGPPGTGKSFLAKAVATEADSTFMSMSSSDLVSKWQGESERLVKQMFELARENNPSIVFIDEIDSLCSSRSEGENDAARRIKTEFLVQMDGVGSDQTGVLVLGATNVPWELDPAMRRRFQKRVYIALPEAHARSHMFKVHIGDTPNDLVEDDYRYLGEQAKGYSGSDIEGVVREALMIPLRIAQSAKQFIKWTDGMLHPCDDYPSCYKCPLLLSDSKIQDVMFCKHCYATRMTLYDVPPELLNVPQITRRMMEKALSRALGSVGQDELTRFEEWTSEFGMEG